MLFLQRLKELREERNLTQNDVAVAIQTSQRNIGRWENHSNEPSASYVIKLADFFQVSTDYLLGRTDDFGNVSIQSSVPHLSEESFNKKICGGNEMPFSHRLKELRYECGLTQKEVSDAVGSTQSNLGKWENNKIQPAADMVVKLADFFQVSTDYLLGRTDDFGNVSVQTATPALSAEETEILNAFRAMTYSQKIRFAAYAEGMLESSTKKKA